MGWTAECCCLPRGGPRLCAFFILRIEFYCTALWGGTVILIFKWGNRALESLNNLPRVTQLAGVMCDMTHRWKPGPGGGARLEVEPGWGRSRARSLGPACVPMCKNHLNGNFEYRLLQNRTCFSLFSFHLSAINTYYLWKNVLKLFQIWIL